MITPTLFIYLIIVVCPQQLETVGIIRNPGKSDAWLAIRVFFCHPSDIHVINTSQNDPVDQISTRVEKSNGVPLF